MGRPLKIMKAGAGTAGATTGNNIGFPNVGGLTAPVTPDGLTAGEFYGVVGGNIASTQDGSPVYPQTVIAAAGPNAGNPVVLARVKIADETEEDGYIARQKGERKYLVYGATSTKTATCVLVNKADGALADGEMTLTVFTGGDSSGIRLSKLTNKYATDWTGVTAGSPLNKVYFVNFFQGVDSETAIKSGGEKATFANGWNTTTGAIELAAIESDPPTGTN
jgi:hypothetical protein